MKKILIAFSLAASFTAAAQKKTVPVKKPATPPPALKNVVDSASYAIGVSVANFYKQQGMKQLNAAMVSKAITDVLGGKKVLLNDQQCNDIIMSYINRAQADKSKPTIAAGQAFLAKNKTKAGIKTTASGIQYEVLREGTGPKPLATDSVTVHYAGTLINGTEFDNSYKRGEPITFPLNGVIAGWTEAVQLMSVGSKYKLYIPHQLAYGTRDVGNIPAGSVLVFEVELLAIPGKQ
jgi:FKBP-type peptidyl-prolyl cis-trans isomerase FklB